MHIVDGALSTPVIVGGAVLCAAGIGVGLKTLEVEKVPAAGVLSATFFVASLVHVPLGPSSVHLIMNGLCGLVLGWASFPALFIALLLQAVFFGFGGLTTLGVNTVDIALPAVIVYYVCRAGVATAAPKAAAAWGALGGGLAIILTTGCVAAALALTGDQFLPAAKLVFLGHIPIMAIEAVLCGAAVLLIRRVKPELLNFLAK
jgi:cobalt/nickel transport system permease protein